MNAEQIGTVLDWLTDQLTQLESEIEPQYANEGIDAWMRYTDMAILIRLRGWRYQLNADLLALSAQDGEGG